MNDYSFLPSVIFEDKEWVNVEYFSHFGRKGVLVLVSRHHPIGGGHYDLHLVKSGPEDIIDHSTSILFEEFRERFSICTSHLGADFPGKQVFFGVLRDFYTEKVLTNKFKYAKEAE